MRYEVLPELPPDGPLVRNFGKPPDPEGLVVRFFPTEGESWVGKFARGIGGATGAIPHPDQRQVIVIAAGSGFVVDPDAPDKVWEFCYAVREFFELVEVKGLLFHDAVTLIAVNSRNDWCRNPRISWDGFRGIRTEGYVVRGEAWCPMSGRWLSFTYGPIDRRTHGRLLSRAAIRDPPK